MCCIQGGKNFQTLWDNMTLSNITQPIYQSGKVRAFQHGNVLMTSAQNYHKSALTGML